jgi:hypothetical protein
MSEILGGTKEIVLGVVTGVLFVFWLGMNSIYVTMPMIRAVLWGKPIELTYVVENPHGTKGGCKNRHFQFESLPFFFNGICDVKWQINHQFVQGNTVVVQGRGTSWGVFPESIGPLVGWVLVPPKSAQ